MLSRVADNLYWMSRYLERAEHNARMLDVQLDLMLDQHPSAEEMRWERLLTSLRASPKLDYEADVAYQITEYVAFNRENPDAIVTCIAAARENARQVREQISSEMWQQLNQLYLSLTQATLDSIWADQPHNFFERIKNGIHLFRGITYATMNHGQGWHFIQAACFLERAIQLASLLAAFYHPLPPQAEHLQDASLAPTTDDYLEWIGLLRCGTAFEAYCKVYSADINHARVAEFLILNAEFPHSIRFAIETVQTALNHLAKLTNTHRGGRVYRLAGRLQADLSYAAIDEIMNGDMQAYLYHIQQQCFDIHQAIYQLYITYGAESVLEA
jgi:uncharacterized alpha-E superfamily protein